MSGPLATTITSAIEYLRIVDPLNYAIENYDTLSERQKLVRYEAQLHFLLSVIRTVEAKLSDLNESVKAWGLLINSLTGTDQAGEAQAYASFAKAMAVKDAEVKGEQTLQSLKQLELNLQTEIGIIKTTLDTVSMTSPATGGVGSTAPTVTVPDIKLAELEPGIFSGDRDTWTEFVENFTAAIDNAKATDQQKMIYLRKYVAGEAKRLIAGLSLNDYATAMGILESEYGETVQYIRELHSELAALKRCNSFEEVKAFQINLERLARQLERNHQDINGPQTFLALEQKLPSPFLREILKEKSKDPNSWNTRKFRERLKFLVDKEKSVRKILSLATANQKPEGQKDGKASTSAKKYSPKQDKALAFSGISTPSAAEERSASARTNESGKFKPTQKLPFQAKKPTGQSKIKTKLMCLFCKGEHWSSACPKFSTVDKKVEFVKTNKLCFACLQSGHMSSKCTKTAQLKCRRCSGRHNTLLCRQSNKQPLKASNITAVAAENFDEVTVAVAQTKPLSHGDTSVKALLMCIEASVFNPFRPELSFKTIVFFDSGSHRSFISTELADLLELTPLAKENFRISGFGDKESKNYNSPRVRFGFHTPSGEMVVTANKLHSIIKNMPMVFLDGEKTTELAAVKLQLPVASHKPDILIGIDLFNDFTVCGKDKLPSGFWICESKLGRFLSGKGKVEEEFVGVCLCSEEQKANGTVQVVEVEDDDRKLNELVTEHFDLQGVGLDAEDESAEDRDRLAIELFRSTLTFSDGRYQVALPWNERCTNLPRNYRLARARLRSTLRTLQRRPAVLEVYHNTIQDYVFRDIIEVVIDPRRAEGPIFYLPHRR